MKFLSHIDLQLIVGLNEIDYHALLLNDSCMSFPFRDKYRIHLRNQLVSKCQSIKFFGVHTEENLNFDDHVAQISKKISRSVCVISNNKSGVSSSVLQIPYFSLIYPHIIFCMSAWTLPKTSNLIKIVILLRKLWRLLPDYNEQKLLKRNNFLNVESMYKLCIAKSLKLCKWKAKHCVGLAKRGSKNQPQIIKLDYTLREISGYHLV